jgi:hypothetical protein
MSPLFLVALINAHLIRPEKKLSAVIFALPKITSLTKSMA